MAFPKRVHDPDANLDYPSDWSDWLETGDFITAVTVTVPAGITLESTTFTNTVAVAWISGGTAGTSYNVTYHITTNDGREDDRTITLVCKER